MMQPHTQPTTLSSAVYPLLLTPTHAERELSLHDFLVAHVGAEQTATLAYYGGIWMHGNRVRDVAQPVTTGVAVSLHTPPGGVYADVTIEPSDILAEDQWLLVLNKRAGWYTTPPPWDIHGNIQAAVARLFATRRQQHVALPLSPLSLSPPSPHLAHQLDRDTSGVLLCSKLPDVHAPLQVAFATGHVQKSYYCVCVGNPPDDTFELRTGHGRKRGGWCVYPLETIGDMLPNGKRIRFAHTSFTVLRRMGDATLLHATLHTGRTHQIRLHVAAYGHPLVGDARYGTTTTLRGVTVPFHLLHAARVSLLHPVTNEPLTFEAPLPPHITVFTCK